MIYGIFCDANIVFLQPGVKILLAFGISFAPNLAALLDSQVVTETSKFRCIFMYLHKSAFSLMLIALQE